MKGTFVVNPGKWSQAKKAVKYVTPPLLVESAKRLRGMISRGSAGSAEWEYIPEGWQAEQTDPNIKGWNVDSVLEAYKAKWPAFVRGLEGTSPFGILSEEPGAPPRIDLATHNTMMSYAYALALSARHKSFITMLDWGGGIGHYYLISRALVPDLQIDYHCKDVPVLAAYGRELFPQAHFYADETCLARPYDFVLVSGSLHYSRDWCLTFQALARSTAGYMFVTRLFIVYHSPSYVFVQRPYQYGYGTEYLGWCLNRGQFLECAAGAGLQMVREFMIGHPPLIHGAPEQCELRGYLFRPRRPAGE